MCEDNVRTPKDDNYCCRSLIWIGLCSALSCTHFVCQEFISKVTGSPPATQHARCLDDGQQSTARLHAIVTPTYSMYVCMYVCSLGNRNVTQIYAAHALHPNRRLLLRLYKAQHHVTYISSTLTSDISRVPNLQEESVRWKKWTKKANPGFVIAHDWVIVNCIAVAVSVLPSLPKMRPDWKPLTSLWSI